MAIQRMDNIGVAVRDLAEVAGFFRDKVGLATEVDHRGEPPSAQVKVAGQYLYVFQTTSVAATSSRHPSLDANPPGLDHVSFTVDDVDRTYAELRDRGIVFDDPPATIEAWGLRMAAFRDPENNRYYLVQAVAQA